MVLRCEMGSDRTLASWAVLTGLLIIVNYGVIDAKSSEISNA